MPDPNEFVVGPGAVPAGNPPIGPVSINCGAVSKNEFKRLLEIDTVELEKNPKG
jgi:hypothetical protein